MPTSATINSPRSAVMQAIKDDFCMEINEKYPDAETLKYKGKSYGYGNIENYGISGTAYSERYLEETGISVDDLTGTFVGNEAAEKFVKNHREFVSYGGWPMRMVNLNVIGELFYIEPYTGKCGYLYDHPEIKAVMKWCNEMIKKGYQDNPEGFSAKGADNSEDAIDFLNELYNNPKLCNLLVYGNETPELSEIQTFDEYRKKSGSNIGLCNENLVDDITGFTAERKQKSYEAYCERWKESKIEGFQFTIPEELEATYDAVEQVIYPSGCMTPEYGDLVNKSLRWEKIWSNMREQLESAGGSQIIEELQRQVDVYIGEK